MTRFATILAVLVLATALPAQEIPTRKMLTPEQTAAGWQSLLDGRSTDGLKNVAGKWNAFQGVLAPEGDEPATFLTAKTHHNCTLEIDYQTRNRDCELLLGASLDKNGKVVAPVAAKLPASPALGTVTIRLKLETRGTEPFCITIQASDPVGMPQRFPLVIPVFLENPLKEGQIGIRGKGIIVRGIRILPNP